MVPKLNGGERAEGDYWQLNVQTEADRYPIPVILNLFYRLDGSKILIVLDLEEAY